MNPSPKKPVRVRLAPSPTGSLHIGTARVGLFNWLFACQNNGKFILRIEDTDKERSLKKHEHEILEALSWLGINWDEGPNATGQKSTGDYGPYRQSERTEIYKKYLQQLLDEKKAYYCYCTKEDLEAQRQEMIAEGLPPKYNGHCRNLSNPPAGKSASVIRFLTSEAKIEFTDLVRGKMVFDANLFGDMVIAKDLENPLYNFAVVIDDEEMKISHVIRGEDHLSNTPKQILLQNALGFESPIYAHLPLILAADRSKLSKRYAETSLLDYREKGYLPEAVLNFMVLLGWHPEGEEEVFSQEELIEKFDIKRVQKSGAIFNPEKLNWLNNQHLKKLDLEKLFRLVKPELDAKKITASEKLVKKVLEIERERMKTIKDFADLADFFFELPDYETKMLRWKDETIPEVKINLSKTLEIIEKIEPENFTSDILRPALEKISGENNRGLVFWPFRVALSGKSASPDPLVIAEILGKKETVHRVKLAIDKINDIRENHYA